LNAPLALLLPPFPPLLGMVPEHAAISKNIVLEGTNLSLIIARTLLRRVSQLPGHDPQALQRDTKFAPATVYNAEAGVADHW
jgi:hypothetical protein